MEDTEYEPTRESYLGTIVRLTEELNAVTQERDAALAVLLELHEQQCAAMRDDYGFSYDENLARRADVLIEMARKRREEVGHE